MAAIFVLAVAAYAEVCLMRERRQYIEKSGRFRLVHLGAKSAFECFPRALVL